MSASSSTAPQLDSSIGICSHDEWRDRSPAVLLEILKEANAVSISEPKVQEGLVPTKYYEVIYGDEKDYASCVVIPSSYVGW